MKFYTDQHQQDSATHLGHCPTATVPPTSATVILFAIRPRPATVPPTSVTVILFALLNLLRIS